MNGGVKWTNILRAAGTVALVGCAVLALVVGLAVRTGRLDLEPVLSGSMRPTFAPGDLVVATRVHVSSLKVGDVVAFNPPGSAKKEMHRIVTIQRKGGKTLITTKGDANNVTDPWGRIGLRGAWAYRLKAVIPKLGWVSQVPKRIVVPIGLVLAGLIFLITSLRSIFKTTSESEPPITASQQGMPQGDFPQISRSLAPPTAVNNQEGCNVS